MQVWILQGLVFTNPLLQTPMQQGLQRRAVYRALAVALLSLGLAWHRTRLGAPEPAALYGALALWGGLSYFAFAGAAHWLSRRVAVVIVIVSLAELLGLNPLVWFEMIRSNILTLSHHNLTCKLGACAGGVAYAACTDVLHEARVRSVVQRQLGHPDSSTAP